MAATGKEEKLSEHEEKILCQWNPPTIPVSDVYERRGLFDVFSRYMIQKVSKTVAIQGEYSDLQLFTKEEILGHISHKYTELHIGMVQVAVKPLTIQGLNCSVFVCLRDGSVSSFGNSRLAVFETSLSNGPIYFTNYPDKEVSLKVSTTNILDSLTLNIRTTGLPKEGGQGHVVVVYRIFYKVLVGCQSKCKMVPDPCGTIFMESNLLRHDRVPIAKVCNWSSLEYPDKWDKWIADEDTNWNSLEFPETWIIGDDAGGSGSGQTNESQRKIVFVRDGSGVIKYV